MTTALRVEHWLRRLDFVGLPVLALVCGISAAGAEVTLAPLFRDGAVLQSGQPVPVWGSAAPGEKVTVRFADQTVSAEADGAGRWRAELAPLAASGTGRDLTAGGTVVRDVVVGEVWLCLGQSNMEYPLKNAPDAAKLAAESHFPLIRQFKVANFSADAPAATVKGTWTACAPETAGAFTAVGYHFARVLHAKLGVPIGLINCTWGGTRIEAWMSTDALRAFPAVAGRWKTVLEELPAKQTAYEQARADFKQKAREAKAAGQAIDLKKAPQPPPGPGTREAPAGLFNGMLAPLIPYGIRGMLWYQGESNAGAAGTYAAMFPALIADLRQRWNSGNLPFYFVQLPNYVSASDKSGRQWAEFRAAQARALSLPGTGMAIVIDGESPVGHPADKTAVGQRLARLAEVRLYRSAQGDASGPLAVSATREGGMVRVRFAEASSGLMVRGPELQGFEAAGADGTYHPAQAKMDGPDIVISSPMVSEPARVRYAWTNNPPAALCNRDGLPASPFEVEVSKP